jgi:meso-butanediol dehydrogenase/(S,S)-butanediol dehydrogenase/diacetyl reductase
MSRLVGQTAVITGGAQGIGRGIALALASEGADIALADVQADVAAATAREVADRGVRAKAFGCDVAIRSDVYAMVHLTVECFGRVDILVNSAHRVVASVPVVSVSD